MNYYEEILHLIKKNEVNKRARYLQNNKEIIETYWNVGRLIVEAQGGEIRANYGNELIKNWSIKLTSFYGEGYNKTNLKRSRQFYLVFRKGPPLGDQLSWSHIRELLPIKDENKRNYYINLCITSNLSKRELIDTIRSNAYERVLDKPKKIEIVSCKNAKYNVREHIKNPIIISLDKEEKLLKEKDLQLKLLAKLKNFFQELGDGYTFVVVELKLRELKKEDKAQIEFYMNIVDDNLKEDFHNNTLGIIVSKYQDDFIVSFVSNENIIPITYELAEK